MRPLSNAPFVGVGNPAEGIRNEPKTHRALNKARIVTVLGFNSCYLLTDLSTSQTQICLSTRLKQPRPFTSPCIATQITTLAHVLTLYNVLHKHLCSNLGRRASFTANEYKDH